MHTRIVCRECRGLGYTTRQEAKAIGRCSSGEMVYSSRTVPINRFCGTCEGTGKVEGEAAAAVSPVRRTRLELALLGLDGERKGAA